MADGVSIRMQDLVRDLKETDKKFAASVRKQVRKAVTEAGAEATAKVRASASWSTGRHKHGSIPRAISAKAIFSAKSAGVRIVMNRRLAGYGGLYEVGNKGGHVGPGTFRNGTGGVVTKRPFFYSSVEKVTPETERKFLTAIDEAVREAGFH